MREFYVGLHQPSDARHFARACVSIRRLWGRKKPLGCPNVLVDSGAFTELSLHGCYRSDVGTYADCLMRLHSEGIVSIAAAVAQDWMCEPFMLAKTGLNIWQHQKLTIERYDELYAALLFADAPFPVMPVLQGYSPAEYVRHLDKYGERLTEGMWVGVGSVCKRNGDPAQIVEVLDAIHRRRPDLRLHGFGVKKTALKHPGVRSYLATADSMAWSFHARKNNRSANDWREAKRFADEVEEVSSWRFTPWQPALPFA